MADVSGVLTWLLVYIVYLGLGDCSELTEEECRNLGFTSNLVCSSCDTLLEYNLNKLVESCRKCCKTESGADNAVKVYPYAELRVCGCKLGRFPQVQAFVKSEKPNQFPGLKIKYVRGADPEIFLYDEDMNLMENLGIEKWNTDSVEQFFMERLKR